MITPQPDDPLARIKALEDRIDELERKTLSNLAVTIGGVKRLEVSPSSGATIRDAAGQTLFSSNNTSGWGVNSPIVAIPMYLENADLLAACQTNIVDTTYRSKFLTDIQVTHPRIRIRLQHQVSGGTATGQCIVKWNQGGPETVVYESPVRGPGGGFDSFLYTFPQSVQNQIVTLNISVRLLTGVGGVDWTAAKPLGLILQGD